MHRSSDSIDELISIHANNFLSQLPLSLSLRALYLNLLTLSQTVEVAMHYNYKDSGT